MPLSQSAVTRDFTKLVHVVLRRPSSVFHPSIMNTSSKTSHEPPP